MLNKTKGIDSYLAFVKQSTTDTVDAALGKNNESRIKGVGNALALYAKNKGSAMDIEMEFPNLIQCDSLSEITNGSVEAYIEAYTNSDIYDLLFASEYASTYFPSTGNTTIASNIKLNKNLMDKVIVNAPLVDAIRNNHASRVMFNKNRIRLLSPGDVSWTVPNDWPTDFIHVQLIGGGGGGTAYNVPGKCGEYKQFTMKVTPGQVITGNIGAPGAARKNAGDVTFAGVTALAGVGAEQTGCFLVKGTQGNGNSTYKLGEAGFEGGEADTMPHTTNTSGVNSSKKGGTGDYSLGHCEDTAGKFQIYNTTIFTQPSTMGCDGSGGSANYGGGYVGTGAGGYGGGGSATGTNTTYWAGGGGGSGAIIITCPDGYIPEYTVYNTIDGVTEWRIDNSIFNDFYGKAEGDPIPLSEVPLGSKIVVPCFGENKLWTVADKNHEGFCTSDCVTLVSDEILTTSAWGTFAATSSTVYSWLKSTLLPTIPETIQAKILDTVVPMWINNNGATNYTHKLHVLSLYETGLYTKATIPYSSYTAKEGTPLAYYAENPSRAVCADGSFWTRTVERYNMSQLYTINSDETTSLVGRTAAAGSGVKPFMNIDATAMVYATLVDGVYQFVL